MKHFFKLICAFVFVSLLINPYAASGEGPKNPGKSASATKQFLSVNEEGLIGVTEEVPVDNPADNIFHVNVDEALCGEEKVWLVYDLEGVEDHTAVSRSINDQVAVGGYLVKKRKGWATQREQINAGWLKEGDNIVRFTMPEKAGHNYRIRDLRFEVEPSVENNNNEVQIIFNQPSLHYFFDKAYIKGFVSGAGYENVSIKVDGREARIFNGEFEAVVDFVAAQGSCSIEVEAIYPDGTSTCHSVLFSEPRTPDYHYSIDHFTYRNEKFFDVKKNETLSLNGAVLHHAADALKESATLSITTLRGVDIPALDGGMVNVTKNHAGFRFLPHGMVFSKEVNIRLPFDPEEIPDGYTEKDIRTYYFDEQSHHWVPLALDTVLMEKGEVVSKTIHFTDMINGIIKVPEAPEAEAYNSTSMKGIKAANPTAAVNLINPPQANNTGNASLGYPINIPAGRAGMQPQLSISYNSGGGNGWMGMGWNLSLPMISIDTRWGVPRYDSVSETETYTMNGEQLTPVAHRGVLRKRNKSVDTVRFYPRVEGAFNRIIRHGKKTSEYWWEVTDKSGTRYFYGGAPAGFDKGAVLRTNEAAQDEKDKGSVAQWYLSEVRDLNGNTVKYHYTKVADAGVADPDASKGYQVYIDHINYTGYQGSDGLYSVSFIRETGRNDKIIMANLGFKQVTADLLRKIEVQFDDKKIRSYELKYKTGEFYKTLLDSISEYDAAGKIFNSHAFEYYNEVRNESGFHPLDETGKVWSVPQDSLKEKFAFPEGKGFSDKASALSGNRSTDFSAGLSVSVTLGLKNLACKTLSIGGNYSYAQSKSEGLLSMVDINGDGLSDKVFLKDDEIKFRANLGTGAFSESDPTISGINDLYREKSKTNNAGLEANLGGCKSIGAALNKGWSWTTSTTSAYFADVNGDQLIDFVKDGKVRFNTIDPTTGESSFTENSSETPNPIIAGAGAVDVITQTAEEKLEAEARHPLHDVVKVWQAPFDGNVKVDAPVRLIPGSGPDRDEAPVDGVRVSVQFKNIPKWSAVIQADDDIEHFPTGLNDLEVKKGDRLYFRVGSIDNGSFDQVQWTPVIEYQSDTASLADIRDANGNPLYRFESDKDFILTSVQTVTAPFTGAVAITGSFVKPQTTDTVHLVVLRDNVDTVMTKKFAWHETVNTVFEKTNINVAEEDRLTFKVIASTNVDWAKVQWKPHVLYTSTTDPNVDLANAPIESFPVPEYSVLANILKPSTSHTVEFTSDTLQRDTITLAPILKILQAFPPSPPFDPVEDDITFSVKKRDTLLAKVVFHVVNGKITGSDTTLTAVVNKEDSIYVEYHVPNILMATLIEFTATVSGEYVETDTLTTGLYSVIPGGKFYHDVIFGPLYRGWGHFAWKGDKEKPEAIIEEGALKLSDALTSPEEPENIDKPEDLDNSRAYDPAKDQFIMLTALGKEQLWGGYDDLTYVTASVVSSSRMGDDDISAPSHQNGTGAFAVNKISKSKAGSFSAGVSGGGPAFSASGNYSWSDGNSTVITDYMDMNGDRYPDIVTKDKIQYTNARGGLEEDAIPHGQTDIQNSVTHSEGVTVAGSAIVSRAEPSSFNIKNVKVSVGSGQNSGGLNGNYARGHNNSSISWMDINGDGLPDRLRQEGDKRYVALNLGYSFAKEEKWNFNEIQAGKSETKSAGLGVAFGNGSVNIGVGVSQSDNFSTYALMDVNGDGLPDQVSHPDKDGTVKVRINTGSHFMEEAITWTGATHINENSSTSESANAAFTIGIPIPPPLPVVTLYINPSGSIGHGINREESKFADMDGDGFPDFVKSKADNELTVYRSNIGKTNLLKGVKRPLGATFTMDYKRIGNTYQMPNDVWALNTVKIFDGFKEDGVDSMLTTYAYEGGLYDRHEREFYGFKKVITRTHDTENGANTVYTVVAQNFANDNYYEKGLLLSEVMTDGDGNKFIEKENVYELKNIENGATLTDLEKESDSGNAFPALVETHQKFYEGQSDPGKSTSMTYKYDRTGNVIGYTDNGDETPEDDLSAVIRYHTLKDLYVIGTPEKITVTNSGTTLRERQSVIDPNTGNITQIKQFLSESEVAVHDMEYDEYGNLTKITRPKNAKDQRLSFEYEYDQVVNTYTTKVSNSYGYSSEATYDFSFGQILSSKDLNGNEITYALDNLGRVINITGPYEQGGGNKTIEFEYHPEAQIPWALTKHFDPSDPQNKLETEIFVDGLGRVLQTKKDAAIFQGEGKADTEMMVVSGRVTFDAFGRTVSAMYPVTEVKDDTPGDFNDTDKDDQEPTLSEYDVLNRTLKVILPDGAVTETLYGFGSDRDGNSQFSTKTTDANGKQTEQFTDVRGRVTAVKNYTSEKEIWTSFKYNAINEQIEAMDDLGHATFSTYDNFGRRITRRHPDAGQTNYIYDLAGNLTQLETANLIKEGLAIEYTYDFERLTNITYPQNQENNVKYTYGEAGASENRAGRIVLQEDASGAQEFFYGPLGEVIKNIRTVVIPQHDEQTYTTQWTYDTWNRLTSVTYADGEKVEYNYNAGGLLRSMSGKKKGSSYAYVNQLGYDKFEQRVYLEYGNGTKTTYDYEPDRRRLKHMTAQTKAKRAFMDNTYTYDKVNNILSLKNNAAIPSANLMGGSSDYSYGYDDLYRLTSAEGSFKGSNDTHTYTLAMSYNTVGGITQKTQVHKKKDQEQKKTTYDLNYTYGETQPHAPIHIGEQTFTYDANGNQTGWTSDVSGQRRLLLWDEENRIRSIYDNGSQHHYIYDAAGERVLKGKTTGQRIFVNGEWMAGSGQMGNYTVYVNPYLVLRSGGYTKHYYIEGQRIVSKLGGGWDNTNKNVKAGGNKVDYVGKGQKVFDGIVKNLKFLGADGQVLTAGKSGKVPPGQISGTGGNVTEAFRYFYHPDHLGSTSYVTDVSGEVYQHLEYMAFGETFVEEHSNTDRTPYLFNGKELDEETGLYYYGARYYDARTSVWQSVDRFAEKYPALSPYNFSGNNPLLYSDPTGDTIIVNKVGTITRNDKTDNLVFMSGDDGKLTSLGEVGKKIDANTIYANLLQQNAEEAEDTWSPFSFKDKVKNKGDWDLKNNQKTIYGLANHTKGSKTTFLFGGNEMDAQDIGNHHFGVVGKAYGLFSEEFMLQQAGDAQIKAGTSKPEWQRYKEKKNYNNRSGIPSTSRIPLPPYGDDPRDQMWIKQGFDYYKKLK